MDQENIVTKQTVETTLENRTSVDKNNKNIEITETNTEKKAKEIGGPKGLEPTRYGDWEKRGRCIDF